MATETQKPAPAYSPNPGPKVRFLASEDNIKHHRSLMERGDLDRGLSTAMLEYQRQLCEQRTDMSGAAANHFKLSGAQEFVHVLKNLAESPRLPESKPTGNLNHGV